MERGRNLLAQLRLHQSGRNRHLRLGQSLVDGGSCHRRSQFRNRDLLVIASPAHCDAIACRWHVPLPQQYKSCSTPILPDSHRKYKQGLAILPRACSEGDFGSSREVAIVTPIADVLKRIWYTWQFFAASCLFCHWQQEAVHGRIVVDG